MSAFTASAVASPGAAKVLASRRSVASRAPMMAARAPVAKFGARAPLSVSAKAGPSGEIKKVRARVIHDAHVDWRVDSLPPASRTALHRRTLQTL